MAGGGDIEGFLRFVAFAIKHPILAFFMALGFLVLLGYVMVTGTPVGDGTGI